MRLRYKNAGAPVLDDRLPLTVQRLQAMVTYAGIAAGTPVIYRVEDADTCEWRKATKGERARVRAWLGRFIRHRGCSPAGHHPVHRVGAVLFWPVSN
jgi:hypothetical protein